MAVANMRLETSVKLLKAVRRLFMTLPVKNRGSFVTSMDSARAMSKASAKPAQQPSTSSNELTAVAVVG